MNAEERAAYIRALVDQAPPLSTDQRARLRLLLRAATDTSEAGPDSPAIATSGDLDVHKIPARRAAS